MYSNKESDIPITAPTLSLYFQKTQEAKNTAENFTSRKGI